MKKKIAASYPGSFSPRNNLRAGYFGDLFWFCRRGAWVRLCLHVRPPNLSALHHLYSRFKPRFHVLVAQPSFQPPLCFLYFHVFPPVLPPFLQRQLSLQRSSNLCFSRTSLWLWLLQCTAAGRRRRPCVVGLLQRVQRVQGSSCTRTHGGGTVLRGGWRRRRRKPDLVPNRRPLAAFTSNRTCTRTRVYVCATATASLGLWYRCPTSSFAQRCWPCRAGSNPAGRTSSGWSFVKSRGWYGKYGNFSWQRSF